MAPGRARAPPPRRSGRHARPGAPRPHPPAAPPKQPPRPYPPPQTPSQRDARRGGPQPGRRRKPDAASNWNQKGDQGTWQRGRRAYPLPPPPSARDANGRRGRGARPISCARAWATVRGGGYIGGGEATWRSCTRCTPRPAAPPAPPGRPAGPHQGAPLWLRARPVCVAPHIRRRHLLLRRRRQLHTRRAGAVHAPRGRAPLLEFRG